ncbi:unnamed protein product [Bursaphelenchus okinawaensis]|uniref:leucine--tRNA ligase n=1 Tax=Bursaphelenchus okinawaensis TaxID=465554 RepID=A0A811K5Y3_9BILA|nr:unnamed protein product [Bursaphelenchus okinawaensis]CAG9092849.1 unnamed protein product [Bursaphelenchus okinawaensis]
MAVKERRKVHQLLEIESTIHELWDKEKPFELDAPEGENTKEEKFLVTFPFPYMNGRLHVGHSFSLSKAEFAVGFERMLGKKALFPFAFHATGMPIKACADKLVAEIETYGNPPVFPQEEEEVKVEKSEIDEIIKDKSKSKKSKAVAKAGSSKYQWNIMKSLGLTDEEIPKFADPNYWLDYFPDYCIKDLKKMGVRVDWRRSFMTTERNLYFDSFVRWQFRKLKALNLIDFGKRYTIYSPKDGQPCMDHDRSTGEGAGPQEYTLIKIKVVSELPEALAKTGKPVYLVAATLRPETMYGQTNCYIHPELNYAAFYVGQNEGEIFVATKRAANNMSYQGFTKESGVVRYVEGCEALKGQTFIGAKLKAPLTTYEHVYALPMLSIKEDKGTGVVTSVPSDSPDDLVTLNELKKKPLWREKWGLKDEHVLPFEPVEIIDIPELGKLSAVLMVEKLKIQSPNEKDKLEAAKKEVYLKGFYNGVMLVGNHKGKKTEEVKKLIQNELIASNEAAKYMEPEKLIISRSGDECVVALCDQWYLDYGLESWKNKAKEAVDEMNTFGDEVRRNLIHTIDWLHEYACSRSFGLGTKLPWDERYLIESLSDSTIYTSYYSFAHLLQKGSLDGRSGVQDVKPEQLNDSFWEYALITGAKWSDDIKVPKEIADKCRREFNFWRAPDQRVSGKDLVQNHLSFYVFNHVAIFGDDKSKWPKGIRANGHLLLNSEKMSKSTGNFLTLSEAIEKFSSDGMRLALADAGDGIEDANFVYDVADAGALRLFNLIESTKETVERKDKNGYRTGEFNMIDKYFANRLAELVTLTKESYVKTEYKNALKYGLFEFQSAKELYREMCGGEAEMHLDLIIKYLTTQVLILSPICPHVSEHIWQLLGHKGLLANQKWPEAAQVDDDLSRQLEFITEVVKTFRQKLLNHLNVKGKKGPKVDPPTEAQIYVANKYPSWQAEVLALLKNLAVDNTFPDNRAIAEKTKESESLKKNKKVMPFVNAVKIDYGVRGEVALSDTCLISQTDVLNACSQYIQNALNVNAIKVMDIEKEEVDPNFAEKCLPLKPLITFS